MRHFTLFLLVPYIFIGSCSFKQEKLTNRGFYYWKTVFSLTNNERQYLKEQNISTLYIRYGDLEWDSKEQKAILKNKVIFKDSIPDNLNVCPTIYIVNNTLDSLTEVEKTISYLKSVIEKKLVYKKIKEVQIDCDWTSSTRTKYFQFLEAFKKTTKWNISATIRLHQIKFKEKTGVPPVSKGLLMCYNMSNPRLFNNKNSIIDYHLVDSYTKKLAEYPIALDVALPLFSWVAVFRNKRFKQLITSSKPSVMNNPNFEEVKENLFRAKKNTVLGNVPIFENDYLRTDDSNFDTLADVGTLIKSRLKQTAEKIILFHFDEKVTNNYEKEDIQILYNLFN